MTTDHAQIQNVGWLQTVILVKGVMTTENSKFKYVVFNAGPRLCIGTSGLRTRR
jgi:hypothetical protein